MINTSLDLVPHSNQVAIRIFFAQFKNYNISNLNENDIFLRLILLFKGTVTRFQDSSDFLDIF